MFISIDKIEADDTIAYIAHTLLNEDVTIMSADQDFLQLVNERITVWSPIKKKILHT
jgi:5'-3' exonuclease